MQTLELEVPEEVAALYRNLDTSSRQQALEQFIRSVRLAAHFALMEHTGREAAQNGLTPDILAELLRKN